MKSILLITSVVAAILFAPNVPSAQAPGVRITYLYDNTVAVAGTKADWGFACLVEAYGKTILFDSGTKPDILRDNMATLKVDPTTIQAVVLSHEHGDHTVGIDALPAAPGLPVYLGEHFRLPPPASAAIGRIGAKPIPVKAGGPLEIFPGIQVSEEINRNGAYEDALIVDTPKGLIVVVGCSHPGIVAMLERIAETTKRPIHTVVGGFHLLTTPSDDIKKMVAAFKTMGVVRTGPTHCTGKQAIELFREAYGDQFIEGGVGTVVSAASSR
jgi:7,8-dihydropterin-6-yl-methyl-4-(beta-D-ribofuranosyl)aminobenzene 5'-phosphate synthase